MAFEDVADRWSALVGRLDRSGALSRWGAAEPALRRVRTVGELPALTGEGADQAIADRLLGALVRLAAVDAGDDDDAGLVLLHLLRPAICTLAGRMVYRGPHVMTVVVSEVMCAIRAFPWRRRTRAYASNIMLDAKHHLWRGELAPRDARCRPVDAVAMLSDPGAVLHGPRRKAWEPRWEAPAVSPEVELAQLVAVATTAGVVSEAEAGLLLEVERRRGYGTASRQRIADEIGICERTLRRRRARTLAALRRVAVQQQLQSVA